MSEFPTAKPLASSSVCAVDWRDACEIAPPPLGAARVRYHPAAFVHLCETLLSALGQVTPDEIRAAWPAPPSG